MCTESGTGMQFSATMRTLKTSGSNLQGSTTLPPPASNYEYCARLRLASIEKFKVRTPEVVTIILCQSTLFAHNFFDLIIYICKYMIQQWPWQIVRTENVSFENTQRHNCLINHMQKYQSS